MTFGEIEIVNVMVYVGFLRNFKYFFLPITLIILVKFNLPIKLLFLANFLYCCCFIKMYFSSLMKCKKVRKQFSVTFQINLIKYISLAITNLIIFIYTFDLISSNVLLIILIMNVISMAFRLISIFMPKIFVESQMYDFMDSIQLLMIALKQFNYIEISWELTLSIYIITVYGLAILGIICTIAFPISVRLACLQPLESDQRENQIITSWIMFHVAWLGLSFYYLFQNLINYIYKHGLDLSLDFVQPKHSLIPICWFFFAGSIINLIWTNYNREFNTKNVKRYMGLDLDSKGIQREIVKIPFDMRIFQTGKNFFVQLMSNQNIPNDSQLDLTQGNIIF